MATRPRATPFCEVQNAAVNRGKDKLHVRKSFICTVSCETTVLGWFIIEQNQGRQAALLLLLQMLSLL